MPVLPAHDAASQPLIERGSGHAFFAFDLGFSIDLNRAERLLAALRDGAPERLALQRGRRIPDSFEFSPMPLRMTRPGTVHAVADARTTGLVEIVLFDFGAASIEYVLPLDGPLDRLQRISEALYEHAALAADARRVMQELLETIRPAVSKPDPSPMVEDYFVFRLEDVRRADGAPCTPADLLAERSGFLASVLRSESVELSRQEVMDAMGSVISYTPQDAAIIDWNGAILFGPVGDDVVTVLEFANVELLEVRFLDDQLDRSLERAYAATQHRPGLLELFTHRTGRDLRRIASFQVDSAALFEGVNNALKLLGDQYLARVYRLAGQRMHLPEWDASILRKIATLKDTYSTTSDLQTNRRMEVLEWIIILLIAAELLLSLMGVFR